MRATKVSPQRTLFEELEAPAFPKPQPPAQEPDVLTSARAARLRRIVRNGERATAALERLLRDLKSDLFDEYRGQPRAEHKIEDATANLGKYLGDALTITKANTSRAKSRLEQAGERVRSERKQPECQKGSKQESQATRTLMELYAPQGEEEPEPVQITCL